MENVDNFKMKYAGFKAFSGSFPLFPHFCFGQCVDNFWKCAVDFLQKRHIRWFVRGKICKNYRILIYYP